MVGLLFKRLYRLSRIARQRVNVSTIVITNLLSILFSGSGPKASTLMFDIGAYEAVENGRAGMGIFITLIFDNKDKYLSDHMSLLRVRLTSWCLAFEL
jgi:hypothetical protein